MSGSGRLMRLGTESAGTGTAVGIVGVGVNIGFYLLFNHALYSACVNTRWILTRCVS